MYIRNDRKILIDYLATRGTSRIHTKETGQELLKEEKEGIVILKLTTENGILNYSY